MSDLRECTDCAKVMWDKLRSELKTPGKWELLFHEKNRLVQGLADRLETGDRVPNPYFERAGEIGKPDTVYVKDEAQWPTIPLLHDWNIIKAFESAGCLDCLPRFYAAGEPRAFRLNPAEIRIGILVAGGNAAGLNMVVDSIVKRVTALGSRIREDRSFRPEIYGYVGGYAGLKSRTHFEGVDERGILTIDDTDPRAGDPCIFLKTLRGENFVLGSPEAKQELDLLADSVQADQLDVLFVIGGNGTFTWASELYQTLHERNYDIALVGGPKTMDWDINYADATFGFRTSVDNAVEFIHTAHWEAQTQDRIAVIELFGANSGFVALHAGFLSGEADYIMIPEFQKILDGQELPIRLPALQEVLDESDQGRIPELEKELDTPSKKHLYIQLYRRLKRRNHAVLVVAEGTLMLFRHGAHEQRDQAYANFTHWLKKLFPGRGLIDIRPRHLIRGTPPCSSDLDLAKYTGYLMADAALAGFTNCAVQLWQGDYVLVPLPTAIARLGQVQPWSPYFWYMAQRYLLS